ncbi:NADPH-dependent FMN reductase [Actinomadura algeriensis]|uniref:NAD(P)H-dependent FMN reductase n=1 Tax=Actinomadura algeriensis TaxID=1679523 RepID=A0ABR9JPI8_9ACTN|nr:NAD(P)H-dependent oxidoreductase [Actinomadura algeriensis]MBE1532476.1 NAD(P)H-dependent FMN reductase [Actinomadura algeriensis]
MTDTPLRLAIVIGSTREGRFGPTVGAWFAEQARQRDDMTIDVLDVAAAAPPSSLGAPPSEDFARASETLAAADAYAVVTCEYNHSYPGTLKNMIDHHFHEWRAKPVGFVSYGGFTGGRLAVEHLRGVFAELHAVTMRDLVSFHGPWNGFGKDGRPVDADGADGAAKVLLDQLAWWGHALRDARAVRPYGA